MFFLIQLNQKQSRSSSFMGIKNRFTPFRKESIISLTNLASYRNLILSLFIFPANPYFCCLRFLPLQSLPGSTQRPQRKERCGWKRSMDFLNSVQGGRSQHEMAFASSSSSSGIFDYINQLICQIQRGKGMDIRQCAAFWNDQFQQDQEKRLPPLGQGILSTNCQGSKNPFRNTSPLLNAPSNNLIQNHYPPMSQKSDNKNQWTDEEEDLLFKLHQQQGNKWSSLALELPARNENSIKNKFYSTLRKGFRKINKYITNIRRKTHPAQMSNNKLVKPDFLTKLTAIADRNYEEKYEVKEIAVTLSQIVEQKLIQLARNHLEYAKNETDQDYGAQQDLLKDIFEFRKNCKKRKGKRKVGHNSLSSEESESNAPSIDVPAVKVSQPTKEFSFKQLPQKDSKGKVESKNTLEVKPEPKEALDKSVVFTVPLFHQKRQKSDDKAVMFEQPFSLLQSELLVEEDDDPRNTFNDHEYESTSKCNSSIHHIIDPSPSNNRQFNNFSEAFLKNIKRVEVSAHMSQASDLNRPEDIAFIEKLPTNNPNGVHFFKSSQLSKICQSANLNISNKSESKMYLSDVFLGKNQTQNEIKEVREEYAATPSFMTQSSCPSKKMTSRGTSTRYGDQ